MDPYSDESQSAMPSGDPVSLDALRLPDDDGLCTCKECGPVHPKQRRRSTCRCGQAACRCQPTTPPSLPRQVRLWRGEVVRNVVSTRAPGPEGSVVMEMQKRDNTDTERHPKAETASLIPVELLPEIDA